MWIRFDKLVDLTMPWLLLATISALSCNAYRQSQPRAQDQLTDEQKAIMEAIAASPDTATQLRAREPGVKTVADNPESERLHAHLRAALQNLMSAEELGAEGLLTAIERGRLKALGVSLLALDLDIGRRERGEVVGRALDELMQERLGGEEAQNEN